MTPTAQLDKPPGLAVQAFWLMVARTAGFAFTLAMPLVMFRVFTQEAMATYKQAFVVVASCVTILPFSVGVSAFYYLGRMPEKRNALIFNIVVYHALIGAAAMMVLVLWPSLLGRLQDNLMPLSPLIGVVVLTWVFSSFLELVATANQDVGYSTAFIVLAQLTKAILLITAAVKFRTVEAVLYAALIQGVLQSVAMLWYLQNRFPVFWRQRSRSLAIEQVYYVVPVGIAGLLGGLQSDIHNYVVMYSFTAAQYAIYIAGTSQIPLMGILSQSINSVLQSRMSALQQERDNLGMLQLLFRSWRTLALVFTPAAVLLFVVRHDFITVLTGGTEYLAAAPIFSVNLLLLIHGIFITDATMRAHADLRFWFLRLRLAAVVLQIVLSVLLVRYIGPIGAVVAMVVGMSVERLFNVQRIFSVLEACPEENKHFARGLASITLASLAAGLLTLFVRSALPPMPPAVRFLASSAFFALTYLVVLVGAGVLDQEERSTVSHYSQLATNAIRARFSIRPAQ